MSHVILDYQSRDTISWRERYPWTPVEVLFHVGAGVLLPIACFAIAWHWYPAAAEYQGGWWAKVSLILTVNCVAPFYPLLLFSILSLCAVLVAPAYASRNIIPLCGLAGGVLLALQFAIVQCISLLKPPGPWTPQGIATILCGLGTCAVLTLGALVTYRATRDVTWWQISVLFVATILILPALGVITAGRALGLIVLILLIFAPACTLISYFWMLVRCISRSSRASLEPATTTATMLTWLGGYALSWDICISRLVEQYSRLPLTQPHCYIATAAARGHSWFVKSSPSWTASGATFAANDQLRILKCTEFCLLAMAPPAHRAIRCIYDWLGPRIARRIRHPLLGDLAYVLLKPFECCARSTIQLLLPRTFAAASTLYPQVHSTSHLPPRCVMLSRRAHSIRLPTIRAPLH